MTDPAYSVHDGVHTLTFPDGTRLVERHPHRDQRGGLWGKVDATVSRVLCSIVHRLICSTSASASALRTTVRRSMASWTDPALTPLRP